MIDLNRTIKLISGGFFDNEKTWQEYLPEAGDWQKTAFLLLGPLIIFSALAAYLLGLLGSGASLFGGLFRPTIMSTVLSMISSAIGAALFAFIVSALAGAFGGKNNFALGLAATAFASIPGYFGQALMWIPWIGGLISLGLFIYALVLLWKIIPIYLEVPASKRVGHYILSLIATIVAMFLLSITVGRFLGPSIAGPSLGSLSDMSRTESPFSGGALGGIAHQAELLAEAEKDRYDPPSDGRLETGQVKEFIRIMERAEEMREEQMAKYKDIAKRAEEDEDISLRDLGSLMGSVTDVAGLQTVEIEVVKSAKGNWAEHQWVRNSLRTAWIQKDGDKAIEHNYKLYEKYKDELSPFIN